MTWSASSRCTAPRPSPPASSSRSRARPACWCRPRAICERLREICDKHGILLIFDEVITGFGRLGHAFATDYFGVTPDLVTTAKGLTNGVIPMGAVFASRAVHDALMTGPENAIELFHGYTYSGHPVACAAGLAALDIYESEGLFTRAAELQETWDQAIHSLKGRPNVIDIRTIGLVAGIELDARGRCHGRARLRRLRRLLGQGRVDPRHRRHHRPLAAADRRRASDRPDRLDPRRRASAGRVTGRDRGAKP